MGPAQAAENIKNLAVKFRGFLEAAEYLEKVGSIEQLEAEATQRKNDAVTAEQFAKESLEREHAKLQVAINDVQVQIDKALEIENNALAQAGKVISEANTKAEGIVLDAANRKSAIDSQIKSASSALKSVQDQAAQADSVLADLNKKIQEVKAHLKSFVGQ